MRRKSVRKDDPLEEMQELFAEIKNQETKFKKALEVCCKITLIIIVSLIYLL